MHSISIGDLNYDETLIFVTFGCNIGEHTQTI